MNIFIYMINRSLGSSPHLSFSVNSLPDDRIWDGSKLTAFADDKKVLKKMIFVCDRVQNIVGKRENAGYQHFLRFPQCFQKAFYSGVIQSGDCVVER